MYRVQYYSRTGKQYTKEFDTISEALRFSVKLYLDTFITLFKADK